MRKVSPVFRSEVGSTVVRRGPEVGCNCHVDLGRGRGDGDTVWELKFIHHLPVFLGLPFVSGDDRRGTYRVGLHRATDVADGCGDREVIGGAVGEVLVAFHGL